MTSLPRSQIDIRLETEADRAAVDALTREAFWNLYRPGCDEHYTTHLIRSHEDFLPDLTFVAEVNGELVGSIVYTRSWLEDAHSGKRTEIATFGPLCVLPGWQRQGVGSALVQHTKALAAQMDYPAIVILGDPHNYCKHGFQTGRDLNICSSDGRYPLGLLVLKLRSDFFGGTGSESEQSLRWTLHTSPVFEFDPADALAYDAQFPPKEKRHQWTQDLFSMLVRSVVE